MAESRLKRKELYEKLARTPKATPRRVAKLLGSGLALDQIQRRFGTPLGQPVCDPFVSPACPEYPDGLKRLSDPPLRIFHKGLPWSNITSQVVAVVGSRKATRFGLSWARQLGVALARNGISVCSGLALGIDGACHRGVISEIRRNPKAGAPIAVLGHGWGRLHPVEHHKLAQEVKQFGLVLTEYQRGSPPTRWSFPARNRIIAALSDHIVVVEAGAKSGSIHTADFALDLGKTVWIVPSSPGSPNSAGVLALLKEGAEVMTSISEFIQQVSETPLLPDRTPCSTDHIELSQEQRLLLIELAKCECRIEHLESTSKWTATDLACHLTELELLGLIGRSVHGGWEIIGWNLVSQLVE